MSIRAENGSRTHEPSLRELTAELDGLREVLISKIDAVSERMDERDRLYKERDESRRTAVDAAFAAQKEAINLALASADRAVFKAENATEKRFESVNEFRGTLDNQQRTLIQRSEVVVLFEGVNEKIGSLTKQLDSLNAERLGIKGGWGYAVGVIGFILAIGALMRLLLTD